MSGPISRELSTPALSQGQPVGMDTQTLTVPFVLAGDDRGGGGVVHVTVARNEHPIRHGQRLLFPDHPVEAFLGFPTCKATVESNAQGYASIFGWVQLVKTSETDWEMDPVPILGDLNTPFCWFGPEPTLFDAPSRDKSRQIDWRCHSFLTLIPDCLLSKDVVPILGFEWGYEVDVDGNVRVKELRSLDTQWDSHLQILRSKYPGWKFAECMDDE